MSGNFFSPWLTVTAAALLSVTLSATASAEYQYYQQQPTYNQASYQPASFNRPDRNYQTHQQAAQQQIFTPPVIMPYVPFDDESRYNQTQQPVSIQSLQHYQAAQHQTTQHQPAANHYQPQARTWRQTPTIPNQSQLSSARQKVLQAARRQLGVRYRWGGNTPRQGFDCSGFTKHAMRDSNITIPRTAAQQSRASRTISRSQLKPGDMIFFKTSGRHINHVGIYLGNGRFIHAASGGGKVTTDDLRKAYWQKRLHKYGTFFS